MKLTVALMLLNAVNGPVHCKRIRVLPPAFAYAETTRLATQTATAAGSTGPAAVVLDQSLVVPTVLMVKGATANVAQARSLRYSAPSGSPHAQRGIGLHELDRCASQS